MKLKCFGIAFEAHPIKVKLTRESNWHGEWFAYCVKWDSKTKELEPLIGFEKRENGKWRVYNRRKSELGMGGWIGEYAEGGTLPTV